MKIKNLALGKAHISQIIVVIVWRAEQLLIKFIQQN